MRLLPARMVFRQGLALTVTASLTWAAAQAGSAFPNYYPNKPGTRWTYSSGETQIIGTPITHKGVKVTPVSHQYGSTTYTQDLLEFRADGSVWLRGVNAGGRLSWYNPPLNVYPPAPLSPGMKWSGATANLKTSNTVVGVTPLKLAAGTFNALTIRTDTNAGGKISTQLTYFVPTMGIVRYETADGSRIDLLK